MSRIAHTQAPTTHTQPSFQLFGRTVFPTSIDHPGENYGAQMGSIAKAVKRSARWWDGRSEKTSRDHTIWVLTLSPCMGGDSAMPNPSAIDHEYVGLQWATINISVGLLGMPGLSPPTGIVVCLTKFGQLSDVPPAENPTMAGRMRDLFRLHLDTITTVAGYRNIRVRVVITDAFRAWSVPPFHMAVEDLMLQAD